MGLFLEDGTRVTKATVSTTADPDPLVTLDTDLYHRADYGRNDPNPAGSIHTLYARAGKVMRQSEVDALFPPAEVTSIFPADGAATGGTLVTIRGRHLDGVTAVTFDGAAGTNLTIVDDDELEVTTPAGTAGPADVVLTDDGGDTTVAGGYTYT